MGNSSLYRISKMHMPFVLRAAVRLVALVNVFVSYMQYLVIRQELFAEDTILQAYMTPQVCYIEKMLKLHISPQAAINPPAEDVILWREDETSEAALMIDDGAGQIFYKEVEFNLAEFTVILPGTVAGLVQYAREIIDRYKLPGKEYIIIIQ